ncbi:acyl-CoA dehydrogenase [Actinomadura sp. LD22]|uniref:Acyl-CoA dehydrogenase n=1 Tax=Actinomadura physcomitrii TaxID=2650748 RepID=A0A6I4M9I4_9ACTN|nr:acyl-CoA dehydrogenase family protein [Actinomadura physcomitrii]MWA01580.1 acyl-CoA dehydrogenase [Actinomadura physcomitrii]
MRWELTSEQKMLQESLRSRLTAALPAGGARAWWEGEDPVAFERLLHEQGWSSVGVPEESHGQGGGLLEQALVAECLGAAAVPSAAWLGGALALALVADSPKSVGLLLDGPPTVLAAPAGETPDTAPKVSAADGRLSGRLELVLGADRAGRLVVRADDGSAYLIDTDAAVVTAREPLDRSRSLADVELNGVAGERLPTDPAPEAVMRMASTAAVLVAADALGAMDQLLRETVAYAKERVQFGAPIGSFQAVQHEAVEMLVEVEAARSITYYAAASVAEGNPDSAWHAAAAKAQVTASACRVADSALMLHGAIGYTWEHDLHLTYKRVRLDHRLFAEPAAWNERIAASLELTRQAEETSANW